MGTLVGGNAGRGGSTSGGAAGGSSATKGSGGTAGSGGTVVSGGTTSAGGSTATGGTSVPSNRQTLNFNQSWKFKSGDYNGFSLDGLGVRGADAHTLNEHIEVDSLAERGRLMAGLLATLE